MKKFDKKKLFYLTPLIIFLVIIFIIGKELISVIPHLKNAENEDIKEYLTSFGLKGAIFLIILQTVMITMGFIPSEFLQIASGIAYGTILGGLICTAGVVTGATVIYLLVNVFKVNSNQLFKSNNKLQEINKLNAHKNKVTKTLLTLFFLPAIPYGVICYYGSSQKISYRRYVLTCIVGTFPSIYLSSLLGNILLEAIGNHFYLVLGLTILLVIIGSVVSKAFTNKKKNKLGIRDDFNVEKPNWFLYHLLAPFVFLIFKIKNNVRITHNEARKLKGPYLILCNHPSRPDFVYTAMCIYPHRLNGVTARNYFYNKRLCWLLKNLGCIPKNLFNPDIETIKNILSVIKNNGIVMMMPEGRLSATGELETMPEGADKLIKKLKVPVVVVNVKGAHLTGAKWMQVRRKGRIDVSSKILLTKEEIENNSIEYIKDKLNLAMQYNDYKWNKTEKIEYKGKNLLKGVTNILYLCPHCKKEFTLDADKNIVHCNNCNTTYTMDNYYSFNKNEDNITDINDWYKFQIKSEKEKIINNPNYFLQTEVILKMPKSYNGKLKEVGKGVCILNKNELMYTGYINNENVVKTFKIENIPALPFGCNEDFEIYADNTFYYFSPINNKKQCSKWSIYAEVAHNLKQNNN